MKIRSGRDPGRAAQLVGGVRYIGRMYSFLGFCFLYEATGTRIQWSTRHDFIDGERRVSSPGEFKRAEQSGGKRPGNKKDPKVGNSTKGVCPSSGSIRGILVVEKSWVVEFQVRQKISWRVLGGKKIEQKHSVEGRTTESSRGCREERAREHGAEGGTGINLRIEGLQEIHSKSKGWNRDRGGGGRRKRRKDGEGKEEEEGEAN